MNATVVIPYFNRPTTILRAARSAFSQEKVVEVIIVDDQSAIPLDKTILEQECPQHVTLRCVLNIREKGALSARIYGASLATQPIIMFLDSDDEYVGEVSTTFVAAIAALRGGKGMAYGDSAEEAGGVVEFLRISGDGFRTVLRDLCLCPFSVIAIHKECLKDLDLLLTIPAWQDDEFVLSVSKRFPIRHVGIVIARLYSAPDSIGTSKQRQYVGLAMLLAKWQDEIYQEFGLFRIVLFRARLAILHCERLAQRYDQESGLYARVCSKALRRMSRAARRLVKPFFSNVFA